MTKPSELKRAQQAEFLRAFDDHAAFCRESLKIRNESGSLVAMELRANQVSLSKKIREIKDQKRPVRLVVLKSRRITSTASVCSEMFHEVPFWSGRKATIIADKYTPAGLEALGYLQGFQNNYTPLTRFGAGIRLPELAKDVEPEEGEVRETIAGYKLVWTNNSFVQVLSAEGGDVGRGGGRHFLLCDEVAWWTNPTLTLTSVLPMVPYLPGTTVIIQSTGNGKGGEFYDLCQKAMDPSNEEGYDFLFLSWINNPECQAELTEEGAKFQASLDREERLLQSMLNLTLKQLKWRRIKIAVECRGDVEQFHQEYPTTPEEAFISSGRPALDTKAVARQPVADGIVGELIEEDEHGQKRIYFEPRDRGALTVLTRPIKGRFYAAGADPSKGIDVSEKKNGSNPDYSVGWIGDVETGEQVALLRARLRPGEFGRYFSLVCKWYNYAYMCPESNDPGFIDSIISSGYPEEWIFQARRMPGDQRSASVQELGYYVDAQSRLLLIGSFNDDLRDGAIVIRSKICQQECYTFVIKPNGKAEHMTNCHDDTVFAGAHFVQARRHAPKRRKEYTPPAQYRHQAVAYGQPRRRRKDEEDDD